MTNPIVPQIPFLPGNYPENDERLGGQPIVIKKTPSLQLLTNVCRNYEHNTAPENFQRPESWTKEEQKKFLISLLMDRVEGVIVIVDIQRALHRLKCVAPDDRAVTLYETLIELGYKYIVLDGNNRLQLIIKLVENRYHIPEGEYGYIRDPQDTSISTFKVRRNKNLFKDLPPAVQTAIENRLIIISEYTQIGYDGLSQVFINTNSGVFPNPQELRNACNSPWADYVRAVRSEVPELLGYMFKNFKKRYCGDDWIVDCLDLELNAIDVDPETSGVTYSPVSQSTKNNLYRSEFLTQKQQTRYLEVFKDLSSYITQMIDEATSKEEVVKLKRKVVLQNLFWMMCNGINSYEHAQQALELHEKAYTDKTLFFAPKGEENDDLTFKNACEGSRKVNVEFRHRVLTEIVDKVLDDFVEDLSDAIINAKPV